ncbi:lytic transglycosylase domain-containing protein [Ramlibacter sp. WS9]|uniref:lytic transglycosylase domain-containing protein n=1 Tax=Ramlibacter sp. WS9 TaxID=1882741 RepID=UPI0011440D8F|nr:lytic transglycosylase domain-containing protein [Ramlibacter sp. WS9]ROZ72726.1 lytic transglycosylase domain-containing protein [Ramlibacter sp. WS9]
MITRRNCLRTGIAGATSLWLPSEAWAGAQQEEALADSVRNALRSAIASSAPPELEFRDIDERLAHLRWLGQMSGRLRSRIQNWDERKAFLQWVWYESKRAALETSLVLGLIQVESNFRKYAVSPVGARGYMQVMPFWARLIGNGEVDKLFIMQVNLRFGCVILRHYLVDRERLDLFMALGRYNGSRGKPQYPNAVLAAKKNWEFFHQPPAPERPADPTKPTTGGPN